MGTFEPIANGSLASFLNAYNLPQVAALIIRQPLEKLDIRSTSAYLGRDSDQVQELAFDNYLNSLLANAQQGKMVGVILAYYEGYSFNNAPAPKEIDLKKTIIDRASLNTYLRTLGYDLNELIRQQIAEVTPTPQTDEQLQQANIKLAEQLAGVTAKHEAAQAKIAELEAQIIEQQKTIELLTEQVGAPADDEPLKGIEKYNADKANAKKFACTIAAALWRMDTKQQIKTGKMAELLKAMLIDFDQTATPETINTIKEWIKPNAPEYAKKSGRPSNIDNEIILTFK